VPEMQAKKGLAQNKGENDMGKVKATKKRFEWWQIRQKSKKW